MPSSGYTGIQIPPGAHAPANTPAEVPHSTGVTSNTIQPTPQTIPAIDPALFSTVSQGKSAILWGIVYLLFGVIVLCFYLGMTVSECLGNLKYSSLNAFIHQILQ